jgi:hypothetical protein
VSVMHVTALLWKNRPSQHCFNILYRLIFLFSGFNLEVYSKECDKQENNTAHY